MDTTPKVDGRTSRHQHRRPELLAGAVEYILNHGIADLSLRPMAKALGVTHATLIRHFESREALIDEVVATIRAGLFRTPAASLPADTDLGTVMWASWRRLMEPSERRQFALLFELVSIEARRPGRFGDLEPMLIGAFLSPMRAALISLGVPAAAARQLATGFLAIVRGLQLDLSVSGDRRRVDAAMRQYIGMVTASLV